MEKKPTTQFGPPIVGDGVPPAALPPGSAAALKYQQEMLQRQQQRQQQQQQQQAAQYNVPVGGGPPIGIPRLDGKPTGQGLSMADYAAQQLRANMSPQQLEQLGPPPMGPVAAPPPAGPQENAFVAMQRGLLPNDTLPEEAKTDPAFQVGMGSMVAQAQPMLAFKYGVIRNGRRLAPQELSSGHKGVLSSKSLNDLQQLQKMQQEQVADPSTAKHMDSESRQAEANAAAGLAGAAARIGTSDEKVLSDDEKAELEKRKALQSLDEFDWQRLRDAMLKDLLNNDEQRKIIEDRLDPMDIADLIMRGRVTQRVTIHPDKLWYEFQSYTGEEDLALKRLLMSDIKSLDVGDQYIRDKFGMMSSCVGLAKINNIQMPGHLDPEGNFDDGLFWKKFNFFIKQGFHMLASIGINYFWFDVRVRKLFVADKVRFG